MIGVVKKFRPMSSCVVALFPPSLTYKSFLVFFFFGRSWLCCVICETAVQLLIVSQVGSLVSVNEWKKRERRTSSNTQHKANSTSSSSFIVYLNSFNLWNLICKSRHVASFYRPPYIPESRSDNGWRETDNLPNVCELWCVWYVWKNINAVNFNVE